jgi:predicted transcriptional regulator of viral defense system
MRATDAIATLEELGSLQWGMVTTGQAEAYGVSRVSLGRLRDDEIIQPVRRGVWALPSADHGPLQELRAAWLSTNSRQLAEERRGDGDGGDVVVSHISAASVHGLGDLIPRQHEFTSGKRRQTTQSDLRFHRADVAGDVTLVDGLPVTSIPRTVEDVVRSTADLDHLGSVIRDALSSLEVDSKELASRLSSAAVRYGYEDGAALVEDSLERAGLPAVAANLSGSQVLARALAQQALPTLQMDFLKEISRQMVTPELMKAISNINTAALAGQLNPTLSSTAKLQKQLDSVTRAAIVPALEHYTRVTQPLLDSALSRWERPRFNLSGSQSGEHQDGEPTDTADGEPDPTVEDVTGDDDAAGGTGK